MFDHFVGSGLTELSWSTVQESYQLNSICHSHSKNYEVSQKIIITLNIYLINFNLQKSCKVVTEDIKHHHQTSET